MEWLGNNIFWLIPLVVAVLSAINRVTVRYDELTGPWWARLLPSAILLLTELLGVLQSKGAAKLFKLPLTIGQSNGPKFPAIILALSLASCGSWQKTTLKATQTITTGVQAAHAGIGDACKPTVAKCRESGCRELSCCPRLKVCHKKRSVALKGLDATMRATLLVLLAVDLKDRPSAVNALTVALESWRAVVGALGNLGIDVEKWRL